MRKFRLFAFLIALSVIAGCIRRPFGEFNTEIYLKLDVNVDLEHELVKVPMPDMMKVVLYDPSTGEPLHTEYIAPEGGYIHPEPGTYDIMVYNYYVESTIIKNENNLHTIEATTNDIPEFVKSQLSPFLSARQKAREEALRKQQEMELQQKKGIPQTKQDTKQETKVPEERIVNEPEHLFIGRKKAVYIPQLAKGEHKEITISIKAESIVETWHVKFTNVTGTQYVSNVAALMSGLVESTLMWSEKDSNNPVTVFFEMGKGKEKGTLFGTFHTFGKHPDYNNGLNIDIGIMNIVGQNDYYHFDVSDQFVDTNKDHIILIHDEIIIKEPEKANGFQPDVEDWEDIETDIII